jgi:hypothetical protein
MLCLATVYSLTFGVFSVQYTIVWHGGGGGEGGQISVLCCMAAAGAHSY